MRRLLCPLVVLIAMFLSACVDITAPDLGTVRIVLPGGSQNARVIFTASDLDNFVYTLELSGPGGEHQIVEPAAGQTTVSLRLRSGEWHIVVTARDTANGDRIAGTGSTRVSVYSGQTKNAVISMDIAFSTYYVSPSGSDGNDGLTTDTPFGTLAHALSKAAFGRNDISVITVLDEISAGGIEINLPLSTRENPLIIKGDSDAPPVISNTAPSHLFTIQNSWVVFDNITIENNQAGSQGTVLDDGAHLILQGQTVYSGTDNSIRLEWDGSSYPDLIIGNTLSDDNLIIAKIEVSEGLSSSVNAVVLKTEDEDSVGAYADLFDLVDNDSETYHINSNGAIEEIPSTDTTAPSISNPTFVDNSNAEKTFTNLIAINLRLNVTEAGSGLKTLTLGSSDFTPGGGMATWPGGSSAFTYAGTTITFDSPGNLHNPTQFALTIPGTLASGEGLKSVTITGASDDADPINNSDNSLSLSAAVTLDTTAPVFNGASINSGAATTTNPDVTYTVTVTEAGSGLASLTVSGFADGTTPTATLNAGGTINGTASVAFGNSSTITFAAGTTTSGTLTISGTLPSGDGPKTIKITEATDRAGNTVSGTSLEGATSDNITLNAGITNFSGLQSAIANANLAAGTPATIVISNNIAMTGTLVISTPITLKTVDGNFTLKRSGSTFKGALFSLNDHSLTIEGEGGHTLTLDGGKEEGLTATSALIKVPDDKTGAITLKAGAILQNSKNTGGEGGGAIYMNAGTLDILGGSIINNEATGAYGGGALMLWDTVFTMSGGNIEYNTAGTGGGGVWLRGTSSNSAAMTMDGGRICNNTTAGINGGGGVLIDTYAAFIGVSGEITENTGGNINEINGGAILDYGDVDY